MNSMDENTPEIWTVSQLTRRVKNLLEAEISYVWVSGEISNWRVSPAGHAYFNLRDEDSQVDVVMFRGKLMQLRFGPENGLEVIIHGLVTVYEKRGNYQIVCDEMEPKGLGALQLAFEKLKRKLDEEGLFDEAHKKPLPVLPRRIGVVTSPTGAAIRDILNVLERRFANVHVILFPARVQGDEAAEEIVEGIRALDEFGVDVMIVGRGGGSLEDLWPFNEEIVVRAVYQVETPIISAVGHEIDFALTDFAADLRAPTPSAAAELVVQEREALVKNVQGVRQRMTQAIAYRLEQTRNRLALARSCYLFQRPEEVVRQRRQQLDELRMRLQDAATDPMSTWRRRLDAAARSLALLSPANQMRRAVDRLHHLERRLARAAATVTERMQARLRPVVAQLDALSPLAILGRGYAIAWKLPEKQLLRSATQLAPKDRFLLKLSDGNVTASAEAVEREEESHG